MAKRNSKVLGCVVLLAKDLILYLLGAENNDGGYSLFNVIPRLR